MGFEEKTMNWQCWLGICKKGMLKKGRVIEVNEKKNHEPIRLQEYHVKCFKCGDEDRIYKEIHEKDLTK